MIDTLLAELAAAKRALDAVISNGNGDVPGPDYDRDYDEAFRRHRAAVAAITAYALRANPVREERAA